VVEDWDVARGATSPSRGVQPLGLLRALTTFARGRGRRAVGFWLVSSERWLGLGNSPLLATYR